MLDAGLSYEDVMPVFFECEAGESRQDSRMSFEVPL